MLSAICTKALGVCIMPAARAGPDIGRLTPSISPPVTAAEPCIKPRRETATAAALATLSEMGAGARRRPNASTPRRETGVCYACQCVV